MMNHQRMTQPAIPGRTLKTLLSALFVLALSAGSARGGFVYYEGEPAGNTNDKMACDEIFDGHPIVGNYFDDTLRGDTGFTNHIYVVSSASYTIDKVRVIKNCGGSETNVLRGPNLKIGGFSTFEVQKGCDYTVRAWMGSTSEDTTLDFLYDDYFVVFRGTLVTPRTSRIKAREASCDSRTQIEDIVTDNGNVTYSYGARVWGGDGGSGFDHMTMLQQMLADTDELYIEEIGLRSGDRVDQISIKYNNGNIVKHGGSGGGYSSTGILPATTTLQQVEVCKDYTSLHNSTTVHYIKFILSNGETLSGGIRRGECVMLKSHKGYPIQGFRGGSGEELDSLGIIIEQPVETAL